MYEKFFNISNELLCLSNREGYFEKVNPSFVRLLGYDESELLSKPYINFVHPEDREKTQDAARVLENGNKLKNFENRYRCKDGRYKVLLWQGSIDSESNKVISVAKDITKLKKTENELNQLSKVLTDHHIIAFTDKKGVITEVNDNFCKISGHNKNELIGKTHKVVNSGLHTKNFWKKLWNKLESQETWVGIIVNRKKNGELYYVYSTIAPLLNLDGTTKGYVALRFEVTNEIVIKNNYKRTINILNETNSIAKVGGWELIVETGELNWTDETFNILEVEKTNDSKPVLAQGLELFVDEHKPIVHRAVNEAIKNGTPYQLEVKARTAKGNELWVFTNGRAHYKYGKVVSLSGTIQDIDDKKITELNLLEEKKKSLQSAKLASLGELSAGIAHEINNPLTTLIGNANILKRSKTLNEKEKLQIERIYSASERIAKITKSLTKFARDSFEDEHQMTCLLNIIDEVVSLTTIKAKKHHCELIVKDIDDIQIYCNKNEIEQVLINLVNNAVDAVKDLNERWVKLESIIDDKTITLTVTDSGEGIPKDVSDKLFDPFFTTKPDGEGTGLGLSISKGIVENHNGEFYIDHKAVNTKFVIKLPKTK